MMNQIILQGRLVRTPELNHTKAGQPVVTVPLACERDVRAGEDGKRAADFFEIVAWDSKAEFLCANFEKGQAVNVIGRLKNRKWTDRLGVEQKGCEIVLDRVYSIAPHNRTIVPEVEEEDSKVDAPDIGAREYETTEREENISESEDVEDVANEEVEDKNVQPESERRFRKRSIERV